MPSLTMNFCAQNILRNQFQKFIFRNTSFFFSCLTKNLKIQTVEQNDIKENW